MIKLYGSGGSRWVRPYWTLQELDVPFEPVQVSVMKGETRTPAFLKINPLAKVPALQDGDFCLFESAAICTYLADKYPEKGLIPNAGTRERALTDQWISVAITELEQPLWRITRHSFVYPEAKRSEAEKELAQADFKNVAAALEKYISSDYLVGGRFSIADIMVTYSLKWATMTTIIGKDLVAEFPRLHAYMERHMARPKFPAKLFG